MMGSVMFGKNEMRKGLFTMGREQKITAKMK